MMPSKNVVRNFFEDGYYHIFNRGVEKRLIFLDDQDHQIFLYYLFVYTQPIETVLLRFPNLPIRLYNKNLNSEVELIAYCLMPNHFHLLLRQKSRDATSKLIKQITNAYTFYFNKKYQRVGSLFQGRFKAVSIGSDELLLHISRYIHLNPLVAEIVINLKDYQWSSYPEYMKKSKDPMCSREIILSYFPSDSEYGRFISDQVDYARELDRIKHLTLD